VNRTLYNTAKRVVDELGKGQEMLRTKGVTLIVAANSTVRETVLVPDVDIVIVQVKYLTFGGDVDDILELYAPANGEDFDETIDAANRIISQLTSTAEMVDNALRTATLTGLNGNVVQAGQPIIALCTEDNSAAMVAFIQISYILADDVRTF
ncbi:hypothetical protein LCGC14_2902880, partial [marine sediment metagenome]